jgi:hypothetical protein
MKIQRNRKIPPEEMGMAYCKEVHKLRALDKESSLLREATIWEV